jgi:hypothetical protein
MYRIRTARQRIAIIALLLSVFLLMCVWYGSLVPAPAMGDYPSETEVVTDYDQYVGDRVSVGGTVNRTGSTELVLTAPDGKRFNLTIQNVSTSISPGDRIRVYGTLQSGQTLHAINTVVVPRTALWYTWGVSLLGGLIVLYRVVRDWRFDTADLAFKPRTKDCSAASTSESSDGEDSA